MQLLGRLHPLIVHLPIGFIILGLILQWYDRKKLEYQKVIPLIFFWGGISAVLACVTGYLQYLGEGYAFDTVKWHLWSGIATALFAFLMYTKLKEIKAVVFLAKTPIAALSILFFVLISFTGHQGGNITRGEDYLIEPLPNSVKSALGFETFEEKEILLTEENWEEALLYQDVVKPILNNSCVSCHNPKKTKGDLLLHDKEGIMKGGENGEVLISKNAAESDLFVRMNLLLTDEDHMPPEGKTQPPKEEIRLIGAWINVGHPFVGTIRESGLEKELFSSFFPNKSTYDYPDIVVEPAATDSILRIKKTGIHIDPISKSTAFLSVSCLNRSSFSDADFERLLPIANNIAILDFGNTQISDDIIQKLTQLPNLTVLKLDNTAISGKNMELLKSLKHLKSINLTATNFEQKYLSVFSDFENLKKLYLYKTKVSPKTISSLNSGQISIDYGNYELPSIPTDSIVY
ncbi:MAG: c-type cytochrome domain-containing protein [Maribacter sp.]